MPVIAPLAPGSARPPGPPSLENGDDLRALGAPPQVVSGGP
jgi:hypothetical protein